MSEQITASVPQDEELTGDAQNVNSPQTEVDLTQCEHTSEKGRRCKLAPGHEGDHRYVIRENVKQPKTLSELRKEDAKKFGKFSLVAEEIPNDADVSRQYTREVERDADQLKVDADAEKMYKRWAKAGSPKGTFEELAPRVGSRFLVPPEAFDTVIAMLRKSTQSGAFTAGKQLAYRRGQHASGNTIINWMIVDHGTFPRRADGSSESNGGN